MSIWVRDVGERARFDWSLSRTLAVAALATAARLLRVLGRRREALRVLGFVWRTIDNPASTRFSERELARLTRRAGARCVAATFLAMATAQPEESTESALRESIGTPRGFDKRLIVLRAPGGRNRGKGVLLIKYTNYFKHFLRVFDVGRIMDAYHVVLEPSWIGFFLPEIQAFRAFPDHRIFVQTWEARDQEFLCGLQSNLTPVALSANAWIGSGVFRPLRDARKVYDVVMVAIWSDFKRHFALFRALRDAGDRQLRVACVGQPWPRTRESIQREAEYYGVEQQVDFYESLDQVELNAVYNSARATLLLSRKEGPNKALVESMFAGTPAFVRSGFNYGTRYPYVNDATGGFVDEADLPTFLHRVHAGAFDHLRPHEWVAGNWNPRRATRILEEAIYGDSDNRLAVKVNAPDLEYLDVTDGNRLSSAYQELRDFLRR